jgi:hypothetical protein
MSQVDDELSFFERERDKLSQEITTVGPPSSTQLLMLMICCRVLKSFFHPQMS